MTFNLTNSVRALLLLSALTLTAAAQGVRVEVTTASGSKHVVMFEGAVRVKVLEERVAVLDFDLGEPQTVGSFHFKTPATNPEGYRDTIIFYSATRLPLGLIPPADFGRYAHVVNQIASGGSPVHLKNPVTGVRFVKVQARDPGLQSVEVESVTVSPETGQRTTATLPPKPTGLVRPDGLTLTEDQRNNGGEPLRWFRVVFEMDPNTAELEYWRQRSAASLSYPSEMEAAKFQGKTVPR